MYSLNKGQYLNMRNQSRKDVILVRRNTCFLVYCIVYASFDMKITFLLLSLSVSVLSLSAQTSDDAELYQILLKADAIQRPVPFDDLMNDARKTLASMHSTEIQKVKAATLMVDIFESDRYTAPNADSMIYYSEKLIGLTKSNPTLQSSLGYAFKMHCTALSYKTDYAQLTVLGHQYLNEIAKLNYPKRISHQAAIYNQLIYAYLWVADFENGEKCAKEGLFLIGKNPKNTTCNDDLAQLHLSWARLLGISEKNEASLSHLFLAREAIKGCPNLQEFNNVELEMASIYIKLGNLPEAQKLIDRGLAFAQKTNNLYGIQEGNMIKAEILLRQKKYNEATIHANLAMRQNTRSRQMERINQVLFEAYSATGKYQKAFESHKTYMHHFLNQKKHSTAIQVNYIQRKLDITAVESELKRSEQNKKWLTAFLGLMSLLIIGLGWAYRTNQNRKKEIETLNEGLEQKVKDRTAELQKAYDEIKEAIAKGQGLERRRVAAELHDNLGSLLSAINIGLEALNPKNLSAKESKIYASILKMTESAYQEVRTLSHNFQPEELEQRGLSNALSRLVEKLNNSNQKTYFSLNINQLPKLDKQVEYHLYSICLELTNNILKHAEAIVAEIRCEMSDKECLFLVSDNGKGIAFLNNSNGMGLKNIESRLESIGGTLKIEENKYKNGLTIVVSVPLSNQ